MRGLKRGTEERAKDVELNMNRTKEVELKTFCICREEKFCIKDKTQ